jgi:hypothetical protein
VTNFNDALDNPRNGGEVENSCLTPPLPFALHSAVAGRASGSAAIWTD